MSFSAIACPRNQRSLRKQEKPGSFIGTGLFRLVLGQGQDAGEVAAQGDRQGSGADDGADAPAPPAGDLYGGP